MLQKSTSNLCMLLKYSTLYFTLITPCRRLPTTPNQSDVKLEIVCRAGLSRIKCRRPIFAIRAGITDTAAQSITRSRQENPIAGIVGFLGLHLITVGTFVLGPRHHQHQGLSCYPQYHMTIPCCTSSNRSIYLNLYDTGNCPNQDECLCR